MLGEITTSEVLALTLGVSLWMWQTPKEYFMRESVFKDEEV